MGASAVAACAGGCCEWDVASGVLQVGQIFSLVLITGNHMTVVRE
jgi:hypothetical protein